MSGPLIWVGRTFLSGMVDVGRTFLSGMVDVGRTFLSGTLPEPAPCTGLPKRVP